MCADFFDLSDWNICASFQILIAGTCVPFLEGRKEMGF